MNKKVLAAIVAIALVAVQLFTMVPALAKNTDGTGELVAKFTTKCWNADKGFTIAQQNVGDNYNFTSALSFKISNKDKFNSSADRNASFYEMQSADASIGAWANDADAEMRFFIKSKQGFTTTLSILNSGNGGYPHIYRTLEIEGSDKWQEIRFKRSDFSANATFDANTKKTTGYNLVRFQTSADFIPTDATIIISPIEFYDGAIKEALDVNGGTILPKEGKLIAEFTAKSWNDSKKGFAITSELVADNNHFTSSMKFKITNMANFNAATDRNASFYELKGADGSIGGWANDENAEMRFWIKSTTDFTATLSLMNAGNGGYPHIYRTLEIKASDKWQEIRFKRSDFSANATFDANTKKTTGYTVFRLQTTADFIGSEESFEISKVQFYDGYLTEQVDPDGGTIIVIPEAGEKIGEFNGACWNSATKGFSVTGEIVGDNLNFKEALKFEITDKAAFNASTDRNANIYELQHKNGSINAWANCPYAEMRFWIRSTADFETTVDLMSSTGSTYPHISAKLAVKGGDLWQEIRFKRSDFVGDAAFNTAVAQSTGYSLLRFVTSPDFLAVGETIEISPIEFYDGFIDSEIDPSGGTIVIPDIYGELKYTLPAKVINSFKGLQNKTVPVTDNDFVSNALKLTATDTAALYEKRQHVYTNGLEKSVDLSDWYNYSKAEIRLWVKVPHAMKLTFLVVESTGKAYPYISTTVEVPAADGWQELRIPRSAFSSDAAFTGEYVKFFRILTPAGEGAEAGFLSFSESMLISQVEFYDGIIPESANTPNKGTPGNLVTSIDLKPTNVNSSVIGEIEDKSNKNFKSVLTVQINNARTFAEGEMSHYLHLHEELIDISKWYNNPNAEIRLWVRTDKDVVLRFGFQNPFAKDPSSYRAIWGQINVSGSDNWQELRIARKNFSENADFDPKRVGRIKIIGSGDTAITTNEIFYVGDVVQVYDGYINSLKEANGGTVAPNKENGVAATFSSFSTKLVSGTGVSIESVKVGTNKYFTAAARIVSASATPYTATLKTFYDLTDISRCSKGTLRVWVKSGEKKNFNIVLTDKNGKELTLGFAAKASADKWQELRVELSKVNAGDFDFSKLFSVSVSGNANASPLEIGKIELWKKTISAAIESDGGTIEPPLVLPPVWEALEKYSGKSEIFARTAMSNFWITDWNDKSRPRSITAYNRGLDNKDENYHRFTNYKEISVVDPDVYYQNPTGAGFGFNTAVDMTPYLKTGTMRFWVKVPKDMSISVMLKSQVDGKYTDITVDVALKKTDENGGFQEVRIPLKKFYDEAVKQGRVWNPYYIKHVIIGGVAGCNAKTFLAKDEILCITQSEFWKGEALEPPPYDPTRIFYSMRGEVFVKDVDEVLAKTAIFSAYRDTLMKKQYENIVNKYFSKTGLSSLYRIELISADAYNYKKVGAYDKVSVYIPKGDINTSNLSVAIYNSTGIYTCDFTVEDDYIVIETKQFGMFLFMSGGKRNSVEFDYEDDLKNHLKLLGSAEGEAGTHKVKNSDSKVLVLSLIIGGAILLVIAAAVVVIVLKKKGIIFRKG